MVDIGIRIDGMAAVKQQLTNYRRGIGAWSRAQIGVAVKVPYGYWIEEGRYYGGRPGQTHAYHYLANAARDIMPKLAGAVLESLAGGEPTASRAAEDISDQLVDLARGYAPEVSGRLRQNIVRRRGGRIFGTRG